jgi:hypothetical protein
MPGPSAAICGQGRGERPGDAGEGDQVQGVAGKGDGQDWRQAGMSSSQVLAYRFGAGQGQGLVDLRRSDAVGAAADGDAA